MWSSRSVTRQNSSGVVCPSTLTWYSTTRMVTAGAAAGQPGQVGPVGGERADAGQPDVGLDADQHMAAGGQQRRDPRHAGEVPIHDPQPVGGEHVGLLGQHPVQQRLLGLALVPTGLVPAGRAAHHGQGGPGQRVGDVQVTDLRVAGLGLPGGAERGPVGRGVGHPGHRAVDRPEPQPAAHLDPGQGRVTVLGPDRGQQLPLQLLQRCLADRGPPGGQHRGRGHGVRPPPRHRGQLSQQRGEHLAVSRRRASRSSTAPRGWWTRRSSPAAPELAP